MGVLTPSTPECDLLWTQGPYRGDRVRMRPHPGISGIFTKGEVWGRHTQGECHVDMRAGSLNQGTLRVPSKPADPGRGLAQSTSQLQKEPTLPLLDLRLPASTPVRPSVSAVSPAQQVRCHGSPSKLTHCIYKMGKRMPTTAHPRGCCASSRFENAL